jgi:putative flavoprotein involved in K+ transport
MPRRYRGKDIFWWLQHSGVAGESLEKVDDVARVRSLPSPQLLGSHQHSMFDLNTLQDGGVQLAGRFMNANASALQFSGALHNVCQLADLKMQRLFSRFDHWLHERGVDREFPEPENFKATQVTENPLLQLPARSVRTIIWATGFRPDYSWLQLPVLNRKGMLIHQGGVVNAPGVYVLGLPALRRRNSSFINGIAEDVCELAGHLTQYLNTTGLRQMHATG